jgi:putative sporulation protein YyaC
MSQLEHLVPKDKKILFFCIGTPKNIGDSVGPLVGSALKRNGCNVMGTIRNPIHALNLNKKIIEAKEKYPDHLIIAIDASITTKSWDLHKMIVKKGSIRPGAGLGINLTPIGDVSIYISAEFIRRKKNFTNNTKNLLVKPVAEVLECRDLVLEECFSFLSAYNKENVNNFKY